MTPRTFNGGANAAFGSLRKYLQRKLQFATEQNIVNVYLEILEWMKTAKNRYNKRKGGRGRY